MRKIASKIKLAVENKEVISTMFNFVICSLIFLMYFQIISIIYLGWNNKNKILYQNQLRSSKIFIAPSSAQGSQKSKKFVTSKMSNMNSKGNNMVLIDKLFNTLRIALNCYIKLSGDSFRVIHI